MNELNGKKSKAFDELVDFELENGIFRAVQVEDHSSELEAFKGVLQFLLGSKLGLHAEVHEQAGNRVIFFSEVRLYKWLVNRWFELYLDWDNNQDE